MAYYLTYGNSQTPHHLVITTAADAGTITEWNELSGQRVAVNLKYDGDRDDLFKTIIKTSLEVGLFRQNDAEFADIINGNDLDIKAFITEGERLTSDYKVKDGSTLLFKGNLTFETWRERYSPVAHIRLIFHDRIGYMGDSKFVPTKRYMNFVDVIGQCLLGVVSADKWLVLNWLYSYEMDIETYDRAQNLIVDVAEYYGETKLNTIEDVLKSFGMQLVTDFAYKIGTGDIAVDNVGATRIRLLGSQANTVNTQTLYEKLSRVVGVQTELHYQAATLIQTIETEEIFSSLFIIAGNITKPAKGTLLIQVVAIGQTWTVYYDPDLNNSTYVREIGGYTPTAAIAALADMLNAYYTAEGSKLTARVGSASYNIAVLDKWSTFVPVVTDYQSSTTTVADSQFDEVRFEHVMNTSEMPLLNNNATFQIDTMAKEIVAVNNFTTSNNILFPPTIDAEFSISAKDSRFKGGDINVYPFAFEFNASSYSDLAQIATNFAKGDAFLPNVPMLSSNGDPALGLFQELGRVRGIIIGSGLLPTSTANDVNITIDLYCKNASDTNAYKIIPFYVHKDNGRLVRWKESSGVWVYFDLETISNGSIELASISSGDNTLNADITGVSTATEVFFMIIPLVSVTGDGLLKINTLIKSINIQPELVDDYPTKLILTTNLNDKNRQIIEFEAQFYNLPDLSGAASYYTGGLFNLDYEPLPTITYNGAALTLLAHTSDMRAQNYQYNRWIFDATIKVEKFRLHDLFTIDGRSCLLLNGSFDDKRGYLTGTFIEVSLPGRRAAWEWQDGSDIQWQNLDRILLIEQN